MLMVWMLGTVTLADGQISNVTYGKNRIQYHDDFDKWYLYETEHVVTHWYGKSRTMGEFVAQMSEYDFDELQNILEHHINDKVQILVYADATDMKQSNIGVEDAFENRENEVKVVGHKVFVFFDGDYQDLRRQIREGITSVYLRDMLHGGSIQQMVQNAISQELPAWFSEGLVSYAGIRWDDVHERDIIALLHTQKNKYKDFNDLARTYPALMGHVLWQHISREYGISAISNILYVSRLSHDLDQNLNYVIDENLEDLQREVMQLLEQRYSDMLQVVDSTSYLRVKQRKTESVLQTVWSPDGKSMQYTTDEIGRKRVYTYDIRSGKTKKIFAYDARNNIQASDQQYPHLAWSPNNRYLYICYEKRDVIYLRRYDNDLKNYIEQEVDPRYQRIYGMSVADNKKIIFSALVDQVTNLWSYNPNTRGSKKITNDYYIDRDPFVGTFRDQKGIFWSSNRDATRIRDKEYENELPIKNRDLYFLPFEGPFTAYRLTETPDVNETAPYFSDEDQTLYYLSDATGLQRLYQSTYQKVFVKNDTLVEMASGLIRPFQEVTGTVDTTFITRQFTAPRHRYIPQEKAVSGQGDALYGYTVHPTEEGRVAEIVTDRARSSIRITEEEQTAYQPRWFLTDVPIIEPEKINTNIVRPAVDSFDFNIPDDYLFITKYPDPSEYKDETAVTQDIEVTQDSTATETVIDDKQIKPIVFSRILSSRRRFHIDDMDIRFDNEVLFDGLQTFTANPNDLNNQPFGILAEMKMSDLFEDWKVHAGVRFPTQFNGSEYFVVLDDNRKRIDKRYAVYRKAQTLSLIHI